MKRVDAGGQLAGWEAEASDPRPRVKTGWQELDVMLRRESLGPGTLVFLAGRMHTRKTAVMLNLARNMLAAGASVGLVGLDEAPYMYVSKLASVMTGISHVSLDDQLVHGAPGIDNTFKVYDSMASRFNMTEGYRPSLADLTDWLNECEVASTRPQVVFIDYLALLERDKFSGQDVTRIPRLCEELQVWTNEQAVVTVALHQVGRSGDTTARYHGSTPMTAEQMMYGGEQQADIVLGTYRPALDPLGNLSQEEAKSQGLDMAEWTDAHDRVRALKDATFLQLLKNRPGVRLHPQGIKLRSVGESQKMEVVP